jgi:hypothetical protein
VVRDEQKMPEIALVTPFQSLGSCATVTAGCHTTCNVAPGGAVEPMPVPLQPVLLSIDLPENVDLFVDLSTRSSGVV